MILTEAIFLALIGLVGTIVGVVIKSAVDRWNSRDQNRLQVQVVVPQQIIDQYQEMNGQLQGQVSSQNEQIGRQAVRIDELASRLGTLEIKLGSYRDYVWLLREHINLRKDPPAPEWPANLP